MNSPSFLARSTAVVGLAAASQFGPGSAPEAMAADLSCEQVVDQTDNRGTRPELAVAIAGLEEDDISVAVRLLKDGAGFSSQAEMERYTESIVRICGLGQRAVVVVIDFDSRQFDPYKTHGIDPVISDGVMSQAADNLAAHLREQSTPPQLDVAAFLGSIDPDNNVPPDGTYGPKHDLDIPNDNQGISDEETIPLSIPLANILRAGGVLALITSGASILFRRRKTAELSQATSEMLYSSAENAQRILTAAQKQRQEYRLLPDDTVPEQVALEGEIVRIFADVWKQIHGESPQDDVSDAHRNSFLRTIWPDLPTVRDRHDKATNSRKDASRTGDLLQAMIAANTRALDNLQTNLTAATMQTDEIASTAAGLLKDWDVSAWDDTNERLAAALNAQYTATENGYRLLPAHAIETLINERGELLRNLRALPDRRRAAEEHYDNQEAAISHLRRRMTTTMAEIKRIRSEYSDECTNAIAGTDENIRATLDTVEQEHTDARAYYAKNDIPSLEAAERANELFNTMASVLNGLIDSVYEHGKKLDTLQATLPDDAQNLLNEYEDVDHFISMHSFDIPSRHRDEADDIRDAIIDLSDQLGAPKPNYLTIHSRLDELTQQLQEVENAAKQAKMHADNVRAQEAAAAAAAVAAAAESARSAAFTASNSSSHGTHFGGSF